MYFLDVMFSEKPRIYNLYLTSKFCLGAYFFLHYFILKCSENILK